jgi:hypothetical protein
MQTYERYLSFASPPMTGRGSLNSILAAPLP